MNYLVAGLVVLGLLIALFRQRNRTKWALNGWDTACGVLEELRNKHREIKGELMDMEISRNEYRDTSEAADIQCDELTAQLDTTARHNGDLQTRIAELTEALELSNRIRAQLESDAEELNIRLTEKDTISLACRDRGDCTCEKGCGGFTVEPMATCSIGGKPVPVKYVNSLPHRVRGDEAND